MRVVRWVLLLPAGVLAALCAYWLTKTANIVMFDYTWINSDWLVSRLYLELTGHTACASAGVYVAARVAPSRKAGTAILVSFVLVIALVVITGIGIARKVPVSEIGWMAYSSTCMIGGAWIGLQLVRAELPETAQSSRADGRE